MDNQETFTESKCECDICKEMNETNKNWKQLSKNVKPGFENTAKRLNDIIKKYDKKN